MKAKLTFLTGLAWLGILATGLANPVITNRPASTTNAIGTTATICVGATGIEPLTYQWRHVWGGGYADVPGATNACLVLPDVQPWINTNSYRVQVCDVSGCVTSNPSARVYVIEPPFISQQPSNQTLEFGDNYTNRVAVTNLIGALSYQWFFNGDPLSGKTNSALTMLNVQATNAGNYHVVVTNLAGSVASDVAPLSVVGPTFTKITNGPMLQELKRWTGVAWGDYDNDGWLDLWAGSSDGTNADRLYRNLGGGEFVRVTNAVTLALPEGSWGAQWGDADNDGDLDLFVVRHHRYDVSFPQNSTRNLMFRNDGGGVFTPMTNATTSVAAFWDDATWVDHNGDGWLDLFVTADNKSVAPSPNDLFWQNLGNGQFAAWTTNDVGTVLNPQRDTSGPAWCDVDGDGDLDLHVSSLYAPRNFLYRNDSGRLIPVTAGSLPAAQSTSVAIWADFNNDGLFDLFTAGENTTNVLHLNRGNWMFEDVTVASGLARRGFVDAASAGDYDNDGDLDLYVADCYSADVLYVNRGDGTFDQATGGSVVMALTEGVENLPVTWVDCDNDGFLDLFLSCGWFAPARNLLYRNSLPQSGNTNHWLKLRLKGTASNADAIGARVWVRAIIGGKEVRQVRQVTTGCMGAVPTDGMRPHFGLGDAAHVDALRIEWPSGQVTERHHVTADQILTVVEPLGLQILGKTADRVDLQLTARAGLRWDLSHCLHLHNLDETCPDTNGHWQLLLSGTNTARTITVSAPINRTEMNRFYKAEPTP